MLPNRMTSSLSQRIALAEQVSSEMKNIGDSAELRKKRKKDLLRQDSQG